jgi:FlaA1/EpsC-like NDP-sugar epimerase
MITLDEAVELVWKAFDDMAGGEIYVKKIPSMSILDIARAVAPNAEHKIIGIRPGEKIHEQMIGLEDAPHTFEYENFYKILPAIHGWASDPERIGDGAKVASDFVYNSDSNENWMSIKELSHWIETNRDSIGLI